MVTLSLGNKQSVIEWSQTERALDDLVGQLGRLQRVLLVVPDKTRAESGAGEIASFLYRRMSGNTVVNVLPAVGTHRLNEEDFAELLGMYPGIPRAAYLSHVHDDLSQQIELGTVPENVVAKLTQERCRFAIPVSVCQHLAAGQFDQILSIGQVVPHEVTGFANHAKNLLIGCGGKPLIDASHWISAVCGLEEVLGEIDTPPRRLLEWIREQWGQQLAPVTYILTVRDVDPCGNMVTCGLFAGADYACFREAAELSKDVNVKGLPRPRTMVVEVPASYSSLWLANKAIYRTRLAIEPGGSLVILAPGVEALGENATQTELIKKFGYRGTDFIKCMVHERRDLGEQLGIAAHLIHGSPEGRFSVRYLTRTLHQQLTPGEMNQIGFRFGDYESERGLYANLVPGPFTWEGQSAYFIRSPGVQMWKAK